MKKNMGTIDRVFRISVALLIAILWLGNIISGTLAAILLALAAIFILTGLIGTCPLYLPFGISTCKTIPKTKGSKVV